MLSYHRSILCNTAENMLNYQLLGKTEWHHAAFQIPSFEPGDRNSIKEGTSSTIKPKEWHHAVRYKEEQSVFITGAEDTDGTALFTAR